jgi:hypothetical protein
MKIGQPKQAAGQPKAAGEMADGNRSVARSRLRSAFLQR